MPAENNNIWVDSTFTEPSDGTKDVPHQIQFAEADTIGAYSMPTIYRAGEATNSSIDTVAEYFQELTSTSGVDSVAHEYYIYTPPTISGVYVSLVEFFSDTTTTSGYTYLDAVYSTGYNTISGALNEKIVFTAGREYSTSYNVPIGFYITTATSGTIERWVNYTNFSGNISASGTPIPYYNSVYSSTNIN